MPGEARAADIDPQHVVVTEPVRGSDIPVQLMYVEMIDGVYAPIGLRTIGAEWLHWRGRSADACWLAVGVALFVIGIRAVAAVVL